LTNKARARRLGEEEEAKEGMKGERRRILIAGALLLLQLRHAACEGTLEQSSPSNRSSTESRTETPPQSAVTGSDQSNRPLAPTLVRSQPLAKMQRRGIRQYLEARGIGMQDIPKALVVYEGISMALL
jgi:hypothetical protein